MGEKNKTLNGELENRLDEIFDDEGGPVFEEESSETTQEVAPEQAEEQEAEEAEIEFEPEPEPQVEPEPRAEPAAPRSPLENLKAVVLSLDWEITEQTLEELQAEVKVLKQTYEQDKIISTFLQLLESLGRYIKVHKAHSHPQAVQLFIKTFEGLERAATDQSLDKAGKKKILMTQVDRFKDLQSKVRQVKGKAPAAETAGESAAPDLSGMSVQQAVAYAMNEIIKTINHRFDALRDELLRRLEG